MAALTAAILSRSPAERRLLGLPVSRLDHADGRGSRCSPTRGAAAELVEAHASVSRVGATAPSMAGSKHEQVARRKLDGFDGLRALAALSVVTYHVALSGAFAHGWLAGPDPVGAEGGSRDLLRDLGRAAVPALRTRDRRPSHAAGLAYVRWAARGEDPAGVLGGADRGGIGPFGAGVFGPDAGPTTAYRRSTARRRVLGGLGRRLEPVRRGQLLRAAAGVRVAGGAGRLAAPAAGAASRVQLGWIAAAGLASLALRGALAGSLTGASTTAADADGEPAGPARLVCDRHGARRAQGRARSRTRVQVPAGGSSAAGHGCACCSRSPPS